MGKRDKKNAKIYEVDLCFNPCCVGWVGKRLRRTAVCLGLEVSILVVLDGWVKAEEIYARGIESLCFNPCCVGWVGKRKTRTGLSISRGCVSILVVLDGWVKASEQSNIPSILPCFNPCCVGWVGKS